MILVWPIVRNRTLCHKEEARKFLASEKKGIMIPHSDREGTSFNDFSWFDSEFKNVPQIINIYCFYYLIVNIIKFN